MRKTLGVWKTTVLGGVLFMLPFAVVVFLLGQVVAVIYPAVEAVIKHLPGASISFGIVSSATLVATLLLLVLCYLAGRIAQRSLAARFAARFEKSLLLLFPRYAIWKNAMASNLGSQVDGVAMKPVLVRFDDAARVGFETDRVEGGFVTVYLPSAPDPWTGQVLHVAAERVTPLAAEFGEAVSICESMGRQAGRFVTTPAPNSPMSPRSVTGG